MYMTLGNIHRSIYNKPSYHTWIPIAMLPIPPKRVSKLHEYNEAQQELDALDMLHQVRWQLLHLLANYIQSTEVNQEMHIHCVDKHTCWCFHILCSWTADHMENVSIYRILTNRCAICTYPSSIWVNCPE